MSACTKEGAASVAVNVELTELATVALSHWTLSATTTPLWRRCLPEDAVVTEVMLTALTFTAQASDVENTPWAAELKVATV